MQSDRTDVATVHREVSHGWRRALCTCGWQGPWRQEFEEARGDEEAHQAESGHPRLNRDAPGTSPAGLLRRVTQATLGKGPAPAVDRLRAVRELRDWLDEQEVQAVIGARMARVTWAEMGEAWGTTRQGAYNRWGKRIQRFESAGVGDGVDEDG